LLALSIPLRPESGVMVLVCGFAAAFTAILCSSARISPQSNSWITADAALGALNANASVLESHEVEMELNSEHLNGSTIIIVPEGEQLSKDFDIEPSSAGKLEKSFALPTDALAVAPKNSLVVPVAPEV